MKRIRPSLFPIVFCWLLAAANGFADSYSIRIPNGNWLIANQLNHTGGNSLASLFPNGVLPDGTYIHKIDCSGAVQTYIYDSAIMICPDNWYLSDQVTCFDPTAVFLNPGEAFFIQPGVDFCLTFTGSPPTPTLPPSQICACGQQSYVARQDVGFGTYQNITGYTPQNGATMQFWNGGSYYTYTYNNCVWTCSGSGCSSGPPVAAVGQGVLVTVPCVSGNSCPCPPQPLTLFNTGVGANGAVLADGLVDPHYALTTNPNGGGPSAFTIAANVLANTATSKWIGPTAGGTGAAGTYVYHTTFNLPCTNNAMVLGQWAADNSGSILLNGSTIVATLNGTECSGNATAWHYFSIVSGLAAGQNTLDISISGSGGRTGLRLELSGTADCCTNSCTNIIITCPTTITTNICGTNVVVTFPNPTITGGALQGCTPVSGSMFPLGTTTVTCTATNACNTNTCTFPVTVAHCDFVNGAFEQPVATNGTGGGWVTSNLDAAGGWRSSGGNPGGTVILNSNGGATDPTISQTICCLVPGQCYTIHGQLKVHVATSNTNDSFAVLLDGTRILTQPAPSPVDTNWHDFQITFTATNNCQTIGFAGEINGTDVSYYLDNVWLECCQCLAISCPASLTTNICGTSVAVTFPNPNVTGGAPQGCIPASGSVFSLGTTTVTCTATNACSTKTCTFTVTVTQAAAVGISCPPSISTNICGTNVAVTYSNPTITSGGLQGCSPISGSPFPLGTTTVMCTATNTCSTNPCSFTVTVTQTPAVGISCPPSISTNICGTNVVVAYPNPTVTGGVLQGCVPVSGSMFPLGTTTVTCTATNACNPNTCTFTVTVAHCDFVNGAFEQPVATNGTGGGWVTSNLDAAGGWRSSGGNPGGTVILNSNGGATDPTISQTICCLVPGQCYTIHGQLKVHVATSNTNDSFAVLLDGTRILTQPAPSPVDTNWQDFQITFTATNNCQTIGFAGEINGTDVSYYLDNVWLECCQCLAISCPASLTTNICGTSVAVTFPNPNVTGGSLQGCVPASGSVFPLGTTTVTCMATNACSTKTCTFTVTVQQSSTSLTVTCFSNKTVVCGSSWTNDTPTASSTCCTTNVTINSLGTSTNGSCPQYITNRWIIFDSCGHTNTCSQTITLIDTNPPVITSCPGNLTVYSWSYVPPFDTNAVSASDCTTNLTKTFLGDSYVTNSCQVTITRTYRVSDQCGNHSDCVQTIKVITAPPPVIISCARTNLILAAGSNCTAVIPDLGPQIVATNFCTNALPLTITQTPTNGTIIGLGMWPVTFWVCDNLGHCAECVTNITVLLPTNTATQLRTNTGFFSTTLPAGDDPSSGPVSLCFSNPICFCGSNYSALYINNNGNATFGRAYGASGPRPLNTSHLPPILAPFWADVDTGGGGGAVKYGCSTVNGNPAFAVTWDNVGYYEQHHDKVNRFQLVLIERRDLPAGNFDFEFRYDRVCWESGDGDGSGGLGGNSARVGYNGANCYLELPGSGVNGALLDSNPTTGLIHSSLGSGTAGVYIFQARNCAMDTNCVRIVCPTNIVAWTCGSSALVDFTASATDACGASVTATNCSPASHSAFPVGTTTVTCTAQDTLGHTAQCSFTVTVKKDTTAPVVHCPGNMVFHVCATNKVVCYSVTASDDCMPNPPVSCTPPPGYAFPVGTTSVSCTATDACGHVGPCSFNITVINDTLKKTLYAGTKDDFQPTDRYGRHRDKPESSDKTRGANLKKLYSASSWNKFDDQKSGYLGWTFTPLPTNLTCAVLCFHVEPENAAASQNDMISLSLRGDLTWRWSGTLASLNGGTWSYSQSPRDKWIYLNLANLPGNINLLGFLNTEHALDVLIGSNTAVDCLRLTNCYCPTSLSSFGVTWEPWSSSKTFNADNGTIISPSSVTNAPYRTNGASAGLGQSGGAEWSLDFPSDPAIGAMITSSAIGQIGGVPDQPAGSVSMLVTSNGMQVLPPDFGGSGSSNYTLTLSLNGAIVFQQANMTGSPGYILSSSKPRRCCYMWWHQWWRIGKSAGGSGEFQVANGPLVAADRMDIEAQNAPNVLDFVSSMTFSATSNTTFTVTDFAPLQFGNPHRLAGRADFCAYGQVFTVGNIGTADVEGRCPPQCIGQDGQDGLIVSLGQAEAFAFEVNPFDAFGPVAEGAALHTSTTGSINGQPDLPLDDLTLSQTGGSVQITADFSRIGLPTARVQVLSNNVVVTDLPGLTGVVASAPDWPVVIGKLGGGAQILNCRVVRWPGSRLFSINGNAYQGDQLNVLAEGLNVNVDYISSFQILAGGMSDFTIVDEQVTPAAGQCPPMAPQIQALGNSHVITWGAGSYHLQVSDDFTTGIWSDLPGVSPMILPSTGAQRYYRLICH